METDGAIIMATTFLEIAEAERIAGKATVEDIKAAKATVREAGQGSYMLCLEVGSCVGA
jgi:hypothetical protein